MARLRAAAEGPSRPDPRGRHTGYPSWLGRAGHSLAWACVIVVCGPGRAPRCGTPAGNRARRDDTDTANKSGPGHVSCIQRGMASIWMVPVDRLSDQRTVRIVAGQVPDFNRIFRHPRDLCRANIPRIVARRQRRPIRTRRLHNNRPRTQPVLNSDLHQPLERTRSSNGSSISGSKISVVVVAAERLFGLGLARLLGEDESLDVIGVSDGDPDLIRLCVAKSVDVVLIDLELSRSNCIDLVRLLALECPATRTLVLTSNPDWRVRPAMIAGAAGVLLKDTSPEATRAAVLSVHLGDQVLCSEAARWVLREDPSAHLTQRESDVLRIMAQGANNAEIARQSATRSEDRAQLRKPPLSQARPKQPRATCQVLGPHRHRAQSQPGEFDMGSRHQ